LVDFHEIWYGGNAIQGDLDAIMFNTIASVILKLLNFKVVLNEVKISSFKLISIKLGSST
jgi:hypothetical protein